jgi:hypothetical protein
MDETDLAWTGIGRRWKRSDIPGIRYERRDLKLRLLGGTLRRYEDIATKHDERDPDVAQRVPPSLENVEIAGW